MRVRTPAALEAFAETWLQLRDLLLPRSCLACVDPLPGGWPRPVCDECLRAFETLSFEGVPVCPRCGVPCGPPGIGVAGTVCGNCRSRKPRFDRARSFGAYEGRLRDAVLRFKFGPEPHLGKTLGILAARAAEAYAKDVDCVIAVPLHPKRLRDRGFNQAAFLAREVAAALELPFASGALRKVVDTAPQTAGSRRARLKNVRSAFEARSEFVSGRRVLLIDDVLTTGATAESCTRVLRKAGARRVSLVTIGRAPEPSAGGTPGKNPAPGAKR